VRGAVDATVPTDERRWRGRPSRVVLMSRCWHQGRGARRAYDRRGQERRSPGRARRTP